MDTIASYKGVRISFALKESPDGSWAADFILIRNLGSEEIETHYTAQRSFTSRELAKQEAIQMARREIDRLG